MNKIIRYPTKSGQRKSSERQGKNRNVNLTLQQSLVESENNDMFIANYEDKINASVDQVAEMENSTQYITK